MKTLALAFAIVLAAAAITFGLLSFFGVAETIAGPIAGLFLSAITYVHQILEKKDPKAALSSTPRGIVALNGFFLPWYVMTVYASFTATGVGFFFGFLVGLSDAFAGHESPTAMRQVQVLALPMLILIGYLAGRWIGVRTDRRPFLVALLVATLIGPMVNLLNWFMVSAAEWPATFNEPKTQWSLARMSILGSVLNVPFLIIGTFRGRRLRLSRYFGYLLSRLPRDTRLTLVNMAYEEADELSGGALRHRTGVRID
jgi:hypothetical protein